MPIRILIVEPEKVDRINLRTQLSNASYDLIETTSLCDAEIQLRKSPPDLVMLSAVSPDDEALLLCKDVKGLESTRNIPVVVLCPRASRAVRLQALRNGADDVLCRPFQEAVLLARVRSLLRERDAIEAAGLHHPEERMPNPSHAARSSDLRATVLFVGQDADQLRHWASSTKDFMPARVSLYARTDLPGSLSHRPVPDVFVIALNAGAPESGLRFLAEIGARLRACQSRILVVCTGASSAPLVDALELRAHDVMLEGYEGEELALRLCAQIRRKHHADQRRAHMRNELQAAIKDSLTGLFNRRYARSHLEKIAKRARERRQDFAVMVADLDHFKRVNDSYGHLTGDVVLAEVARRLRTALRTEDLVARIGGEEFLIVMPNISRARAQGIADRLCRIIRETPIVIPQRALRLPITISIGLVMGRDCVAHGVCNAALQDMADRALYRAKIQGRDRVILGLWHKGQLQETQA
ncbi:MAG: diguanylate cyclase [Rhodobacteraceae bacterium]|nr:diguanylate cyclase [Paracoccaceae bacterium]